MIMFTTTKLLLKQLYRLLTLLEMSFIWWLFIAFFWLLGLASPASFGIANFILLTYYYLGLLPVISRFLNSSYGQYFCSKNELKLLPYLLVLSISILTLPGIAHYFSLAYSMAFFAGLGAHLILHAIWLRKASTINKTLQFILIWLLILGPFWMEKVQQFLATPRLSEFAIAGLIVAAIFAALSLSTSVSQRQKSSRPPAQQCSVSWRSKPKYQSSLAASYLFQYNAKPVARLLLYCGICTLVPVAQTLTYFWFNSEWRWFPELGWKLLDNSLFALPFFYWLYILESTLGRVKSAWLFLPQGRNAVFSVLEQQFLTQLILLSLPLLVLLYCWQPENPVYLLSALMLCSLLLLLTYLVLCFPKSTIAIVSVVISFINLGPDILFLAKTTTLCYTIGSAILSTLLLRYLALRFWQKRDYTKTATFAGRQHV